MNFPFGGVLADALVLACGFSVPECHAVAEQPVVIQQLPFGLAGNYIPGQRVAFIPEQNAVVLAARIIHEGQHVIDMAAGMTDLCLLEQRGFNREADTLEFYGAWPLRVAERRMIAQHPPC